LSGRRGDSPLEKGEQGVVLTSSIISLLLPSPPLGERMAVRPGEGVTESASKQPRTSQHLLRTIVGWLKQRTKKEDKKHKILKADNMLPRSSLIS
jgi:hypothetical protein